MFNDLFMKNYVEIDKGHGGGYADKITIKKRI